MILPFFPSRCIYTWTKGTRGKKQLEGIFNIMGQVKEVVYKPRPFHDAFVFSGIREKMEQSHQSLNLCVPRCAMELVEWWTLQKRHKQKERSEQYKDAKSEYRVGIKSLLLMITVYTGFFHGIRITECIIIFSKNEKLQGKVLPFQADRV